MAYSFYGTIFQDGWFWDASRNDRSGTSYYLFSADGVTTQGQGTSGYTVASNLPELDSEGGSYNFSEDGIDTVFIVDKDSIKISGLPNHAFHGAKALDQTVYSIEAIYWEGGLADDSLDITFSSSNSNTKEFFYWGESGDDTLTIRGGLGNVQNYEKGHVGTSFAGGKGYDTLIIDEYSSGKFQIQFESKDDLGSSANGYMMDSESLFKITYGSTTFSAFDVEEVRFKDITFKRSDILLSKPGTKTTNTGTKRNEYFGGNSGIDNLSGGAGKDVLNGQEGRDKLKGGSGHDIVIGGIGSDKLYGGKGDDVIIGGKGFDRLKGGAGDDEFVFEKLNDLKVDGKGRSDTIADFNPENDLIDISEIDANLKKKGNQKFEFIGEREFSGIAGEVRFSNGSLQLYNGNKQGNFVLNLSNIESLDADSLLL